MIRDTITGTALAFTLALTVTVAGCAFGLDRTLASDSAAFDGGDGGDGGPSDGPAGTIERPPSRSPLMNALLDHVSPEPRAQVA